MRQSVGMLTSQEYEIKIESENDIKAPAAYKDKLDRFFDQDRKSSDGEDDSETVSENSSYELQDDFSKSFLGKVPDSLRMTFDKIDRLKYRLKSQMTKCEDDIRRDLAKFDGSVKRQMDQGSIKETTGDKSIKRIRNVIRDELTKVYDELLILQNKVDKSADQKEESKKDK